MRGWKTSQSTSKEHLKHQDLIINIISGIQKPCADNRKARLADTSAKAAKVDFHASQTRQKDYLRI